MKIKLIKEADRLNEAKYRDLVPKAEQYGITDYLQMLYGEKPQSEYDKLWLSYIDQHDTIRDALDKVREAEEYFEKLGCTNDEINNMYKPILAFIQKKDMELSELRNKAEKIPEEDRGPLYQEFLEIDKANKEEAAKKYPNFANVYKESEEFIDNCKIVFDHGNEYFSTYKVIYEDYLIGKVEKHEKDVLHNYYVAWYPKKYDLVYSPNATWETETFDTFEEAVKSVKDHYDEVGVDKNIEESESIDFNLDDALADVTEVAESIYKGSEINSDTIRSLLNRHESLKDKYTEEQKDQIVDWFIKQEELLFHESDEETSGTQVTDIAKKEEYQNLVKPFKKGKKINGK